MSKRALGRGLGALLPDSQRSAALAPRGDAAASVMLGNREAKMIPLGGLRANPHQPRKTMADEGLQELAQSIQENGVLQPILVRKTRDGYEIVAGERRARAAQIAGLAEIPALVCSFEEAESMKVALLENIQRENLNAIEEAQAYQMLMEHYGATHQELADMLGKNRSTVTNMLRLLQLEVSIREMVVENSISMGHARTLLAVEDSKTRLRLARAAAKEGMSVRALEKRVQHLQQGEEKEQVAATRATRDPDTAALREFESRLFRRLGAPCQIRRRSGKGRIEIEFFSDEELERLLEEMGISSQL
jgi:ParB family transcriptional regulator, chromosome partitioning protein